MPIQRFSLNDQMIYWQDLAKEYHMYRIDRFTLGQRIKVPHPNRFASLGHLQRVATDSQADVAIRLHVVCQLGVLRTAET